MKIIPKHLAPNHDHCKPPQAKHKPPEPVHRCISPFFPHLSSPRRSPISRPRKVDIPLRRVEIVKQVARLVFSPSQRSPYKISIHRIPHPCWLFHVTHFLPLRQTIERYPCRNHSNRRVKQPARPILRRYQLRMIPYRPAIPSH